MNERLNDVKEYLENSYSGAKMMDDVESMTRIARALAALQANVEEDIFTEEFMEKYVLE